MQSRHKWKRRESGERRPMERDRGSASTVNYDGHKTHVILHRHYVNRLTYIIIPAFAKNNRKPAFAAIAASPFSPPRFAVANIFRVFPSFPHAHTRPRCYSRCFSRSICRAISRDRGDNARARARDPRRRDLLYKGASCIIYDSGICITLKSPWHSARWRRLE